MTIKPPYWLRYSAVVLVGCVFFGLLWRFFYQGRIGVDFGFLPAFFAPAVLTFALIIACLSVFLPHWWKALTKEQRWFGGVLLGGLFFCISLSLSHVKIEINAEVTDPYGTYATAVLGVLLIIATVMVFLAQATPRMFEKRGGSLLYPVILLLLAVFISIPACFVHRLFPSSVYFLVVGAIFFFRSLLVIIEEETLGATLPERATYESRKKKIPSFGKKSCISEKVFNKEVRINKGDTILAVCDSIEEGRLLAEKIIKSGKYGIYVTADRPWTIIREDFKDYQWNLYCIDCFTNFYGFDEFKEAENCLFRIAMDAGLEKELNKINDNHIIPSGLRDKFKSEGYSLSKDAKISKKDNNKWEITDKTESERKIIYILRNEKGKLNIYIYTENFYPCTPRPVTVRQLHSSLRDIRKRIVSTILCKEGNWDIPCEGDVWSRLNGDQEKKVKKELGRGEKEKGENVKIIYDSVTALASIFDIEDLLKFLVHDTNVDKTIGRNTLLLVKEGVFEKDIIARLETFCEITLKPKIKNGKLDIEINKIRDEKPPEKFSIDC